jgi:thioredoxin 1
MENLTKDAFKSKIFDYEASKEWKYSGAVPVIVDFYADWCAPCRMVAPILEEISKEFAGRILVYKVNTDAEAELSTIFGVQSIPSVLFIPLTGQPQMAVGAMSKEGFLQAIKEVLKV